MKNDGTIPPRPVAPLKGASAEEWKAYGRDYKAWLTAVDRCVSEEVDTLGKLLRDAIKKGE